MDELRECQVGRDGPDEEGLKGFPRDSVGWGGKTREGLAQEVAWEVGLRKRKGWCAKSVAVAAGRAQGGSSGYGYRVAGNPGGCLAL